MIESYLSTSRRIKPTNERLVSQYNAMYECILAQVKNDSQPPELYITYSSERRSELLAIQGREYIIHDQYLGQAFNKLNRIQCATHGKEDLSRAIASRYLAEKLLCLGSPVMSAFMAIAAVQFDSKVQEDGDPFNISSEHEQTRLNMIVAQEAFVISHELSHFRFSHEEGCSRGEANSYIDEFLDFKSSKSSDEDNANEHYKETLRSQDCVPEIFADDLGAIIAYQASTINFKIPQWDAYQGIILAFKYLRLFQHLDSMAYSLSKIALISDPASFKTSLKSMGEEVWSNAKGLRFIQLREHFLRYRLQSKLDNDSNHYKNADLSYLIEEYDEKTEFPIVFGLVDSLHDNLTPEMLADLAESPPMKGNTTELIDKMTNWSK